MPFAQFRPTKTRGRKENNDYSLITMRNNGIVHLNTAAYEEMNSPEFVTFLYNEDDNSFAIHPVDAKQSGMYILAVRQMSQANHGYDISAQTFMEETGFANKSLRKWRGDWDAENRYMVCNSDNEIPVTKAERAEHASNSSNGNSRDGKTAKMTRQEAIAQANEAVRSEVSAK